MECGLTIIDNFLDEKIFDLIKKNIVDNSNFPWYYNDYKVNCDDKSIYNYQFTHMFYTDTAWGVKSDFFNLIFPLVQKIDPSAIIRIKGNFTMASDEIYEYGMHKDILGREVNCTTGIFYLNTNNGYTLFENGDKVESISNRLVFFNSEIKHTGTTCTDEKFRCVINLNYFQ